MVDQAQHPTPINTQAAIQALKTQGSVEVLAKPRIRALNNQTAIVKVGEEVPIFTATINYISGNSIGTTIPVETIFASSVTIGTVLFLTPQISGDGMVAMDITPVLTSLNGIVTAAGTNLNGSASSGGASGTTAADTETKQASTLVRVRNDTTVVLGGLIQTEKDDSVNKVPLLGDIPFFGKALFTGTFHNKIKKELVIFLTPHIVEENEPSVASPDVGFEVPRNSALHPTTGH